MNTKHKRIEDAELLRTYHDKNCIICGLKAEPAHVKSRGAGGSDSKFNLMPLCRYHHQEQHKIGILTFINKYPSVEFYLKELGWEIADDYLWHELVIS